MRKEEIEKIKREAVEDFSKQLIDTFMDKAEELNFCWHYGMESILIYDIVNLINNTAKTDYKRFGPQNFKWEPHESKRRCERCTKYFSQHPRNEHKKWCVGCAEGCDEFVDKFKVDDED